MDYKISNICAELGIGKSTVYKRMETLKQNIPETDWKKNDFFYYTENNKLFFTQKGFDFIRDFNTKKDNYRHNSTNIDISFYQNQVLDVYKKRIEYLESENKRLLDIIALREQREIAKDMKYISNSEKMSFLDRILNKFKK